MAKGKDNIAGTAAVGLLSLVPGGEAPAAPMEADNVTAAVSTTLDAPSSYYPPATGDITKPRPIFETLQPKKGFTVLFESKRINLPERLTPIDENTRYVYYNSPQDPQDKYRVFDMSDLPAEQIALMSGKYNCDYCAISRGTAKESGIIKKAFTLLFDVDSEYDSAPDIREAHLKELEADGVNRDNVMILYTQKKAGNRWEFDDDAARKAERRVMDNSSPAHSDLIIPFNRNREQAADGQHGAASADLRKKSVKALSEVFGGLGR